MSFYSLFAHFHIEFRNQSELGKPRVVNKAVNEAVDS